MKVIVENHSTILMETSTILEYRSQQHRHIPESAFLDVDFIQSAIILRQEDNQPIPSNVVRTKTVNGVIKGPLWRAILHLNF